MIMKGVMFSMAIISAMSILGCTPILMDKLDVRPSKTTVTYGTSTSTAEKDAKNDVLTDTEKESWTVKQEFIWGRNK
jgi:hypothetical protein